MILNLPGQRWWNADTGWCDPIFRLIACVAVAVRHNHSRTLPTQQIKRLWIVSLGAVIAHPVSGLLPRLPVLEFCRLVERRFWWGPQTTRQSRIADNAQSRELFLLLADPRP
jgi:hypothetical protein